MKTCNTCKLDKELSEFRRDSRLTDGHQSSCKICVSSRIRTAYPEHYRKKSQERSERYRIRDRALMSQYLSGKSCRDCGETDPVVFDFHHTTPSTKTYAVATMVGRGVSWDSILKEIEKCVILCANCHRREHRRLNC